MNIRKFRQAHNLTQKELSELLNMSEIAIKKVETDKNGVIPAKNYNSLLLLEKIIPRYKTHRARLRALEREYTRLVQTY